MIVLLSRRSGDTTTDVVANWLERLGARFFRLNVEDLEYPSRFSYSPTSRFLRLHDDLAGRELVVDLAAVRVVWYRRWTWFERYHRQHIDPFFTDEHLQQEVLTYLAQELGSVGQAVWSGMRHARWIGDAASARIDKTRVLSVAHEVGLDVPATIIATTREALLEFQAAHPRAITKSLAGRPLMLALGRTAAAAYTSEFDRAFLEAGPEVFFPTLVQEQVAKAYEIRSFVLGDRVWSMAIFSQADAQTATDFRRYNDDRPNRNVPYQLPAAVEARLLALMRKLGLDTGSADLIRDERGRHVFLEVNPVGQFGMTSVPCNYHLEREVARYLIDHAR